jgi:hypothetical protein
MFFNLPDFYSDFFSFLCLLQFQNGDSVRGITTMLIGCRKTLVRDRARGLVGYDVALTRRRSPVRIRSGPWYTAIHIFLSPLLFRCITGFWEGVFLPAFHLRPFTILLFPLSGGPCTGYRERKLPIAGTTYNNPD